MSAAVWKLQAAALIHACSLRAMARQEDSKICCMQPVWTPAKQKEQAMQCCSEYSCALTDMLLPHRQGHASWMPYSDGQHWLSACIPPYPVGKLSSR